MKDMFKGLDNLDWGAALDSIAPRVIDPVGLGRLTAKVLTQPDSELLLQALGLEGGGDPLSDLEGAK